MDFSSFFDYPGSDRKGESAEYEFLPAWSTRDWDKLLNLTQTQLHRPGDIVIRAGDTERALYILIYGTLEVLVPVGGSLVPLATIPERSVVGEQTFLDGKPRSATIRAATDSQTLYLSFTAFETFHARQPELAYLFILDLARILSLRFRQRTALMSQWRP